MFPYSISTDSEKKKVFPQFSIPRGFSGVAVLQCKGDYVNIYYLKLVSDHYQLSITYVTEMIEFR